MPATRGRLAGAVLTLLLAALGGGLAALLTGAVTATPHRTSAALPAQQPGPSGPAAGTPAPAAPTGTPAAGPTGAEPPPAQLPTVDAAGGLVGPADRGGATGGSTDPALTRLAFTGAPPLVATAALVLVGAGLATAVGARRARR